MKVTAVETVVVPSLPEYLWVRVETDEGLVGTGETMPRVAAVEAVVHDVLAPLLVGGDVAPESFWQRAFQALSYHGWAGSEARALSALDMALWDLLGQAAGLPVHRLLGGPCRDRVPAYNTCVSHGTIRDHERFMSDPGGLARDLVDEGWPAMKIWPFDDCSTTTNGQSIDRRSLTEVCRIFAAIREAVGGDIEVALEGHSCWGLPAAVRIAKSVEEFELLWLEDMLPATNPASWASLRESTSTPICGSERLFARAQVAPFLEAGAVDVVKQDLAWTGGFTEMTKVAALAAIYDRPVAPHNCHGPVGAMATLHLSAAIPNLFLMESVRAFTRGFFADLVDTPPVIAGGWAELPDRPGLGVRLLDDVVATARRRRTDGQMLDQASVRGWTAGDPWTGQLDPGH